MRNSILWAAVIRQALLHITEYPSFRGTDWNASKVGIIREAKAIHDHWQDFQHDPSDWLNLKNHPNARSLYRRALKLVGVGGKQSPRSNSSEQ